MDGAVILSKGKTWCAASRTVSMNVWWDMVTSLSLEKTGMMQSEVKCSKVTSLVLASMKGSVSAGIVSIAGWNRGRKDTSGVVAGEYSILGVCVLVRMVVTDFVIDKWFFSMWVAGWSWDNRSAAGEFAAVVQVPSPP